MVYTLGLELGFTASHFEVRKANQRVWQYHERLGAVRTREDAQNLYYSIGKSAILALLNRYRSRITGGIFIDWDSNRR